MRHFQFIILTLMLATLFVSCRKYSGPIRTGTYEGIFTVDYTSDTYWYGSGTQTGRVVITLEKAAYSCSSNRNRIPAGGSGTYVVDDNKITFADENFWTAEFDWELILQGEYEYTCDGRKLTIWKENHAGRYQYELERK